MEEERRAKRSKFDQGPKDSDSRRSASPERSRREKSEVKSVDSPKVNATSQSPAMDKAAEAKAKAQAMAAKMSALLKAKKASSPATPLPLSISPAPPRPPPEEVNEDGDYVKDIEVNDLRNRYLLVKESGIQEIKEKTGAEVEVRGKYYPDKAMATERDPPLFLHITSKIKNHLEAAIGMVNKLINQDLGPLVDERRFRKKEEFERDEYGRRKWPEERVPIGLAPVRGFHLRAAVVGTSGANVKWVQSETRTRIQIKGQGSGFDEPATGRESDDPMFLHITGPDQAEVFRARQMCEDLLVSVRAQYDEFKQSGGHGEPSGGDRHDSRERSSATPGYGPPPGLSMDSYGSAVQTAPPGASFGGYDSPAPPASIPPYQVSSRDSPFGTNNQYGAPPPPPPPPPGPPGSGSTQYDSPRYGSYGTPPPPPPPPPGAHRGY